MEPCYLRGMRKAARRLFWFTHQAALAAGIALGVGGMAGAGGCVRDEAKHKAAGNILFRNGDLTAATREFRAAVAGQPKDANAHTLLGNALFESGELDAAKQSYEEAVRLDPGARQARRGLATVALRKGDVTAARAALEALVKDAPADGETQGALGRLLLSQGDLPAAEEHLRDAVAVAQNDVASLYSLGLTLAQEHKREEALLVFDRLEKAAPGQPMASYGRAVTLAQAGQADGALDELSRALAGGLTDLHAVANDPALANLKADPRFGSLLARAQARPPK